MIPTLTTTTRVYAVTFCSKKSAQFLCSHPLDTSFTIKPSHMTVGDTWILFCLENLTKGMGINVWKGWWFLPHTIVFKIIGHAGPSVRRSLKCEETFEPCKRVGWKYIRSKLCELFPDLTRCWILRRNIKVILLMLEQLLLLRGYRLINGIN